MRFLVCLILTITAVLGQDTEVHNAQPEEERVFVGQLLGSEHGIAGKLYAVDEEHLLLTGFEYDGKADDAFFWVGTSGEDPSTTGTILPYPFGGVFYRSDDTDAPVLFGTFNGSVDIRLTLPEELKVTDLKWFSVWSRAAKKSFGETIFPKDFSLNKRPSGPASVSSVNSAPPASDRPQQEDSRADLPPPLVHENAHDPKRHDQWGDSDAKPEAEAEPEGEPTDDTHHHDRSQPRRNSASGLISSFTLIFISSLSLKSL